MLSAVITFLRRSRKRPEVQQPQTGETFPVVHAAWATVDGDGPNDRALGVLVTNLFPDPVFDLRIPCTGNPRTDVLTHPSLPPGRHFFRVASPGERLAWRPPTCDFADAVPMCTNPQLHIASVGFLHQNKMHTLTFSAPFQESHHA